MERTQNPPPSIYLTIRLELKWFYIETGVVEFFWEFELLARPRQLRCVRVCLTHAISNNKWHEFCSHRDAMATIFRNPHSPTNSRITHETNCKFVGRHGRPGYSSLIGCELFSVCWQTEEKLTDLRFAPCQKLCVCLFMHCVVTTMMYTLSHMSAINKRMCCMQHVKSDMRMFHRLYVVQILYKNIYRYIYCI